LHFERVAQADPLHTGSAGLFALRIRRAQLSIHLAPDSRNDVRHRFHIPLSGVKVDNTGTKQVVAADHSVGDECLTSALQPIDQLTVERVEMKFNL
jgi:hypothetical protein